MIDQSISYIDERGDECVEHRYFKMKNSDVEPVTNDQIIYKKEPLLESDVISELKETIWELVKRAQHQALCEGINANTILINKNMCKVNSFPFESFGYIRNIPPMICGMNVYFTKDELPENYSFAIMEGPNNRLAEFESIGMEPDELRKAAELYRRVKEVL